MQKTNVLFNKSMKTQSLTQELSLYGLRPDEWMIEQKAYQKMLIKNKKEQSFCFIGEVSKKQQWKNIELYSL